MSEVQVYSQGLCATSDERETEPMVPVRSPRENVKPLQTRPTMETAGIEPAHHSPRHSYIETRLSCPLCEIGTSNRLRLVSGDLADCEDGHRFKLTKYGELEQA